MVRHLVLGLPAALLVTTVGVLAAQAPAAPPQQPARDTSARTGQQPAPPAATGRITGRVLAADTGRPVPRARVTANGGTGGGSRSALTDPSGVFDLAGFPAGRYTLNVSKSGFVNLSYGQRRPLLPGTPLQLDAGQHLSGIEFRLPRGSVISGHVLDELGDPMPGTMVQVLRYQLQQGERRLAPAGNAQTDDRGQYRVWGLNPGEYFISARPRPDLMVAVAAARGLNAGQGPPGLGGRGGRGGGAGVGGRGALIAELELTAEQTETAYAPTYFPGVASIASARPVTVGLSAEALDVNFSVLLVPTATVAGRLITPDGASRGNVNLVPDFGDGSVRALPGPAFNARIGNDGAFEIRNVPPGSYLLRARSDTGGGRGGRGGQGGQGGRGAPPPTQFFGAQSVVVNGDDISDLIVTLSPGSTIAGTVVLEGSSANATQELNQFRLNVSPVDSSNFGPGGQPRTEDDGRFTISNVPAGFHWLRAQAPRGWSLKSLMAGGRDATDAPIEIKTGDNLSGVTAVFTNRQTEINGSVTNDRGAPAAEYTVLVFPTDSLYWRPQSRHIMTTRPDQNGKYQLRGLPPGDYYVATIDPLEQGEWFDPAFLEQYRGSAVRVQLDEGATRSQDLRVR